MGPSVPTALSFRWSTLQIGFLFSKKVLPCCRCLWTYLWNPVFTSKESSSKQDNRNLELWYILNGIEDNRFLDLYLGNF